MSFDSKQQAIYEILCKACSQNPLDLKDAENKIQLYEIEYGYCLNLLTIITNYSIDPNVRCMAGVCLKNAIDKYWRKSAQNSIKEEERCILRANLLNCLNEPDLRIARQLSVIIGKLARSDVPIQWNELIPKLIHILRETSTNLYEQENTMIIHNRCLMVLHQVIKALASKRLCNDRKVFEEMTQNIIDLLTNLAFTYIQKCLIEDQAYNIDQAILLMKILDKLVLHGFKEHAENTSLNQLMENVLISFDKLLVKYKNVRDDLRDKYEYLLVLYVNILSDYQETYPLQFVNCMQQCLSLIINLCFTYEGKQVIFKKLNINLMNLLKSIIMCDKYKPNSMKHLSDKQLNAIEIRKNYFTNESLNKILNFLFNEYLVFTLAELKLWCLDEEDYLNEDDQSADSWKFSIRSCCETLFQTFVHEFSDISLPIIYDFINNITNTNQVIDQYNYKIENFLNLIEKNENENYIRYILLKDVSYNCACISAWELMQHIDFDNWFNSNLMHEIMQPYCNDVIKRRILLLISNWINIKLSTQYRESVYEIVTQCLQSTQNLVVRLQATLTLKCVLDDVHFEKDVYLKYLNIHFGLLCQLLKEVKECDTKIKVLSVLSFIIERVDVHIRPYSAQLANYLPFLWNESQDHNMLRCSIVTAFNHLVRSFGAQSVNYHSFLIPIINYSTDVNNPSSVYLLEDGLELWNMTVQNSLQMSRELLELFSNIKNLLDRDTEVWKLCLDIIDAYIVLDANQLFQYYSDFLVPKFCELLTDSIKIDALLRLMRSISQIFEIPKLQVNLFEPFIVKSINLSLNPNTYPMIMAMCLNMLAKPVLDDSQEFMKVIEKCALANNLSPEQLLSNLLDSWIEKIDMIVHPEKRKLTALALTSLLKYKSDVIYKRFNSIMNVNVTVMLDIIKEDNNVKYDCLVITGNIEEDDEEVDTEHEKRRRRLRLNNLVYTVSMRDYCIEKLKEFEILHGQEQFQKMMSCVDSNVMQKLNELLS